MLSLMGLALVQAWLYRVSARHVLRNFWLLVLFYLLIFYFARGLKIFCGFCSISFYESPIFAALLFLVFGRGIRGFARFPKANSSAPNFYLLSGLWIGLIWISFFSQGSVLDGFKGSLLSAFFFLILIGIKERLEILDAPSGFKGLPLLLISAGIFLLGFYFFKAF